MNVSSGGGRRMRPLRDPKQPAPADDAEPGDDDPGDDAPSPVVRADDRRKHGEPLIRGRGVVPKLPPPKAPTSPPGKGSS